MILLNVVDPLMVNYPDARMDASGFTLASDAHLSIIYILLFVCSLLKDACECLVNVVLYWLACYS